MSKEVDLIKEKLDIVDVIKSYIDLKKAGRNFKGLCPFHDEKTPSFVVSPEREIFHCFGCNKGGDLIEFVKLYEGFTFPEVLRFLAKKAGIPLKNISRGEQKNLDVLYDINAAAKDFFVEQLKEHKNAQKYLKIRGFNDETIKEFELGFAPGGDSLAVHLMDKGFDIKDIVKSGLAYKRSRGMHKDRFQKRLMFPIVSEIDRVVAFTGRISPVEEKEGDAPKYMNSPETPVYNKSKLLYGLYNSKSAIVNTKEVFLVEGQMDFLMLWQHGFKNTVAVSGTGLTDDHLNKLKRIADTAIVSFDNDEGGLRALERSLDMFNANDFHVKVVDLGDYSDPAEAVQKDSEFFKKQVENARPAFTHLFDYYFNKQETKDIAEKKNIIRHLLKKIDTVESSVERDVWLKKLSEYSNISQTALEEELNKEKSDKNTEKVKFNKEKESNQDYNDIVPTERRVDRIAKRLLMLGFTDDSVLSIVKTNYKWFPKAYKDILDDPESGQSTFLDMQSSFEIEHDTPEEAKKEVDSLIRELKIEGLRLMHKSQKQQLKNNPQDKDKIGEKITTIAKKIEHLKRGEQ